MRTFAVVSAIAALRAVDAANPVRKVVSMLQTLQTKISAEGEKEKELYEKYMCYCKSSGGNLAKGIAEAEAKATELPSAIEEGEGKLAQLKQDIEAHKTDREAAKSAMARASALRAAEKAKFDSENTELLTNIAAISKAVSVIERGMGGAFLQTASANTIRGLALASTKLMDVDRQDLLAFLSGRSGFSGEIVGILKEMGDEFAADQKDALATEESSVIAYDAVMAAKTKEVEASSKMIVDKLQRASSLALDIQVMKNDLGDSTEGLLEDRKFIADLESNCASKTKLYEENILYRGQELVAIAETIKILNDDDALELFKKTLPGSGSASFLQMQNDAHKMKARALSLLNALRQHRKSYRLDFIALSLEGQKSGFEKVINMIDSLVAELKSDQILDNEKQQSCQTELDTAADGKLHWEKAVSDGETAVLDSQNTIATTTEEIATLEDTIKALHKSITEAGEQRKEEQQEYLSELISDGAAKELLEFAKNRLNKFYNPKLYKPPAPRVLTEEEHGVLASGGSLDPTKAPGGIAGTGVTVLQTVTAPPPPPTSIQAYAKQGEGSNGVIAMIDLLIKDLDKSITEAEVTEKDAQKDYESFYQDSADKYAEDSKTLTDKQGVVADLKAALEDQQDSLKTANNEVAGGDLYIHALHLECDWLIKYFDMRKEARDNEIDSLGRAKAVLSGADYSLLQTKTRKYLRGT